jgi:hypothetical protein
MAVPRATLDKLPFEIANILFLQTSARGIMVHFSIDRLRCKRTHLIDEKNKQYTAKLLDSQVLITLTIGLATREEVWTSFLTGQGLQMYKL